MSWLSSILRRLADRLEHTSAQHPLSTAETAASRAIEAEGADKAPSAASPAWKSVMDEQWSKAIAVAKSLPPEKLVQFRVLIERAIVDRWSVQALRASVEEVFCCSPSHPGRGEA